MCLQKAKGVVKIVNIKRYLMRLQSKKLNQPLLPPMIAGVFLLSLLYWLYLSLTTHMSIVFDAIGYETLGRLIYTHGWIAFFQTGPNREPLYPLLVAISMAFEHITGLAFTQIMAFFGVVIMFLTQVLTYTVLRLLHIRDRIAAFILVYLALSPALNNAAFSLFSEIAEFPFVLSIILTSYFAWDAIKQKKNQSAFIYGMLLGISLTLATLVKAVFECIAPFYLIIFFVTIFLTDKEVVAKKIMTFMLCMLAAASFFYVPITGYKWLNLHYNGNFVVTNRGPWFLYGNTARRMEPLSPKRFAEALAFVPGEGVCNGIYGVSECAFWTFQQADEFGLAKQDELIHQHLPAAKIDHALIYLSIQKASQNPFQYTLLTVIEGLKGFFWESTQVGFVSYPAWLGKIYDIKLFNNGLRLALGLLTGIAVVSLWLEALRPGRSPISFLMGVLIFLYLLFFSLFFILERYMLPIAPLYLIAIGIWLNQNLPIKK
jgi:hypothetical protein